MSEVPPNRMKVSREGMVLLKSFEGFRPRAVRLADGGWVIGYGHTRSAREGLTVGEADAELLLQYDLIPVVACLHERITASVNQHQFDALASFAFSLGVERFTASDVLARVNAGAEAEAADALFGWPETVGPDTALRRRAAERALFTAAPGAAVTLADLLSAPLPLPVSDPSAEQTSSEPAVARAAAVARLLGEAPETEEPTPEIEAVAPVAEAGLHPAPTTSPSPSHPVDPTLQRYSPYRTAVVGPLAALEPRPVLPAMNLSPIAIAREPADALVLPVAVNDAVEIAPEPEVIEPEVIEPEPEVATSEIPATEPETELTSDVHVFHEPAAVSEPEPVTEPEPVAEPEPVIEAEPVVEPEAAFEPASFEAPAPAFDPPVQPLETAPETLVLTPPAETETLGETRPIWSPDQRTAAFGADEAQLFEDGGATDLGPVLRHEIDESAPRRFDLGETGAFIFMGGVGLVSFGAAMAAFRRAAQQPTGGDETALVGWVLALIALICVGVSTFNLYQKWGRPQAD